MLLSAAVAGEAISRGVAFPFVQDKIHGKQVRIVAVEPTSCPTLTKGEFRYDFGDTAGLTPLMMMYTLGHDFMPPGIHAGGLTIPCGLTARMPALSRQADRGYFYGQTAVFEAAIKFSKTKGLSPLLKAHTRSREP